ncbi:MAG: ribulose-phosphate 3-epimerase [Candidatus Omnitrophota bacterium]
MNRIIPALLTDKKEELLVMLKTCSQFCDYVQIDIMDGEFVPSGSITISGLEGLKLAIRSEAHLMVSNPLEWLEPFKKAGTEKIIYHFEIQKDHLEIIAKIREAGMSVGLAINPPTVIEEIEYLVDKVDTVLFLSVNPGFYGACFISQVLEKIKAFKAKHPDKKVSIDGGIKLNNALSAKNAGADDICVGSAILKNKGPKQAYLEFLNLLNG